MAGSNQFTAANPQGAIGVTPLGNIQLTGGVSRSYDNLVLPSIRNLVGDIQSVWCDASVADDPVIISNGQTKQYARFPPGTFGWQSLLVKNPVRFDIFCAASVTINVNVSTSIMPFALHEGGEIRSSEGSNRTDVAGSLVAQQFLPENARRQGFSVWNESSATLYLLLFNGIVSPANYTVQLGPGNYFESPFRYGGEVWGVWSAALGGARVTEFL